MAENTASTDLFEFHTLEQLETLQLSEVEALWELVPTERQQLYKAAYERAKRERGAISDGLELELIALCFKRYTENGYVPVGNHWTPTPEIIRKAAIAGEELYPTDDPSLSRKTTKISPIVMILAVSLLIFTGFLIVRGLNGRDRGTNVAQSQTETARVMQGTLTPTPLALDAQDSIIQSSDSGSAASAIFPVNLKISTNSSVEPRIFVIQRRLIRTTEWSYDDNPDTASLLNGLVIRPVLGIPWSESNYELFSLLDTGSIVVLQMNTGTSVQFEFTEKQWSSRGDTRAFTQREPGLILVLLGKHSDDVDEVDEQRLIVSARYIPAQELSSGAITSVTLPTVEPSVPSPTATPTQRIDVQVVSIEKDTDWIRIRLRLYNGRYSRLQLGDDSIWIAFGYAEHPVGPRVPAEIAEAQIEPGQAADIILLFAWHGEPFATLGVLGAYEFGIVF